MNIVFIQGAFEIINYGHIRAFKRAKSEGDYLIVALNTNRLLEKYKKRKAVLPWYQKKAIIESVKWVDKVVPAHNFSPMELLKRYRPKVYCLTREWESSKSQEIAFMREIDGRVVFMPRYSGAIPTSQIKQRLLEEAKCNV